MKKITRPWQREQLIGISVNTIEELQIAFRIGVNMAEIKSGKFVDSEGKRLCPYEERMFKINYSLLGILASQAQAHGVTIQLHPPKERKPDILRESGINIGMIEHHDEGIARIEKYEGMFFSSHYIVGSVIPIHPPLYRHEGIDYLTEEETLEGAKIFFERLDDVRIKKKHKSLIGVENQPDPTDTTASIGNKTEHFIDMLGNTRTIGLTVDTRDRGLAKDFSVRKLLATGIPINNFHFHGNSHGRFSFKNFDANGVTTASEKEKALALSYENYLRLIRRHRIPIVLEIPNLENWSIRDLKNVVERIKKETI